MVFPKLAVKNNHLLERQGLVENFLGREEDLIQCSDCPAFFIDNMARNRHQQRNIHVEGRVVFSEEGIRSVEQEEELEALQKSTLKPKSGRTRVDAQGDKVEEKANSR
jgi:hypothetical protein